MLKFYQTKEKMQTLSAQLSWSHYCELLILDSLDEINYYIMVVKEQNLSVRGLREKIKSNEYERLDEQTKRKLTSKEKCSVTDFVKNPIIIKSNFNEEELSEKVLKRIILNDIESFLEELGIGFTFIKSEYKIKFDNTYNYIDLLLFNYEYNCFVVVELKVTDLKKEHVGQIQVYMNYIDQNLKSINHNKTIGIIICKQNNKYVIKYCSDERIIAREYILG